MIRSRVYVNGVDVSDRLHRDGCLVLTATGHNTVSVRTPWISYVLQLLKKLSGR